MVTLCSLACWSIAVIQFAFYIESFPLIEIIQIKCQNAFKTGFRDNLYI